MKLLPLSRSSVVVAIAGFWCLSLFSFTGGCSSQHDDNNVDVDVDVDVVVETETSNHHHHHQQQHVQYIRKSRSLGGEKKKNKIIPCHSIHPSEGEFQKVLSELEETDDSDDEENDENENDGEGRSLQQDDERKKRKYTVPITFHVIMSNKGNGHVPASRVEDQIEHLNQVYNGSEFYFDLQQLNYYRNREWYRSCVGWYGYDEKFKRKLRVGSSDMLNIYSCNAMKYRFLGYSPYPWDYKKEKYFDGVVVDSGAVKGGYYKRWKGGDFLAHEVGHWLGLLHPFGTNCSYDNDGVDDTPIEQGLKYKCNKKKYKDTCPEQPGQDSLHNYMALTGDKCMKNWTQGQFHLMKQMWRTYRKV